MINEAFIEIWSELVLKILAKALEETDGGNGIAAGKPRKHVCEEVLSQFVWNLIEESECRVGGFGSPSVVKQFPKFVICPELVQGGSKGDDLRWAE